MKNTRRIHPKVRETLTFLLLILAYTMLAVSATVGSFTAAIADGRPQMFQFAGFCFCFNTIPPVGLLIMVLKDLADDAKKYNGLSAK